jgi:hypothetical protein
MNGSFKIAWYKAKQELNAYKMLYNRPLRFSPTDVIPLINKAWTSSFGNIEKSRKALADRGWRPLNKYLLTLEHIKNTREAAIHANVDNGVAGVILDNIMSK